MTAPDSVSPAARTTCSSGRQASGPLMAEVALSVGCDEESAYEVTRRLALGESADVLATLPEPACA